MDILKYTDDELAKNFALLETHLKQAPAGDEKFCEDCINKHLLLLEGLAEEGLTAEGDVEKYQQVYDFAKKTKGQDYKKKGIDLANKTRNLRKKLFSNCLKCATNFKKSLNSSSTSYDLELNENEIPKTEKMVNMKELGTINAGQFAAEGVKYLGETVPQLAPYASWIPIGSGVALQALGFFWKKANPMIRMVSVVAGSNLLATGVVNLVKGVITPAPAQVAAVTASNNGNGFPGKTFGGRVTAKNVPTQYARAGILAGAQQFSDPAHADLIRVD